MGQPHQGRDNRGDHRADDWLREQRLQKEREKTTIFNRGIGDCLVITKLDSILTQTIY